MSKTPFFRRFAVIVLFFLFFTTSFADHHLKSRHLLHQPLYPVITPAQPPSPSPDKHHHHKKHPAAPPPQDKHLFSSVTSPPPPPPTPHSNPFFPSNAVHPSPPPPPASIPTFPANISSLFFPPHNNPSKPRNNRHVAKLVSITVSVVSSSVLLSLLVVLIIYLRRTRRLRLPAYDTKSTRSDSLQLLNAASPSDNARKHKHHTSSHTSSDFLYLGTLVNSRSEGFTPQRKSPVSGNVAGVLELPPASSSSSSSYHNPGSPELRPLPPLPKLPPFSPVYLSPEQLFPKRQDFDADDDEFFSPRGSSGRKQSVVEDSGAVQSVNGSNSCSPTSFHDSSPTTSLKPKSLSPPLSETSSNGSVLKLPGPARPPPPPPPPPPPQFFEIPAATSPSPPPSDPEILKPKLKPLHWDKVRASSSRVMVWDQIKSNSFQ